MTATCRDAIKQKGPAVSPCQHRHRATHEFAPVLLGISAGRRRRHRHLQPVYSFTIPHESELPFKHLPRIVRVSFIIFLSFVGVSFLDGVVYLRMREYL
jgi:hypothetical protein